MSQRSLLRHISLGDDALIPRFSDSGTALDGRTAALVRLAALIVRDAALPGYQRAVQAALDSGATVEEVLALLPTLANTAGSTAVVAAAPKLAMALGYDVDAGYEGFEELEE
jgi:alkylhydroperoxidase/carboxymuconolactone decarboxylase family protein YurZ